MEEDTNCHVSWDTLYYKDEKLSLDRIVHESCILEDYLH